MGMKSSKARSYVATSVLVLFFVILLSPAALALQASPASFTHASADGDTRYTLTVTNDEVRSLTLTLLPNGPLASYLDFEESFTLAPGESRAVLVRLRLPESLQPGTVDSGILIEGSVAGGGTVAASTAVMHVVRLVTPQEGAFLAGELLSSSGIVGEEALITVALRNTGSQAYSATPTVFIDGRQVVLDSVLLTPGEVRSVVVPWTPRAVGQYDVTATVSYAQKQASFGTTITVGELDVEITSVAFGDFRLGEPFRVSVGVLNRWGAPLPVTVTSELFQNGNRVAIGGPLRQEVLPLRQESFVLFLESTGAVPGPASLKHTAVFAGRERVVNQDVVLGIDGIVLVGSGEESFLSVIIVVLLVLLTIGAFIIYRRTGSKRRK